MAESAFAVYDRKRKKSPSKPVSPEKDSSVLKNCNVEVATKIENLENGEMSNKKKSKKRKRESITGNVESPSKLNVSSTNIARNKNSVESPAKSRRSSIMKHKVRLPIEDLTVASSPAQKAVKLLEWLLAPLKSGEFFDTYWEKQALHIQHNDVTYYESILSTSDIDEMLRKYPLHFGRNVDLVRYENGEKIVESPEGRAMASIVWDSYSQGNSVRILNPHTYNFSVHLILEILQEFFGTLVGANVYLTPPGSQGFAPHFDDIEAFVVQLEGRKHWKLYKAKHNKQVLPRFSSNDFARDELGEMIFDNVLEAGDILYFPRGTVHEAKTDADVHSLHITISTYQQTSYADLIEAALPQALAKAIEGNVQFRKGLPRNYLKYLGLMNKDCRASERMEIFRTLHKLFDKVAEHIDVDSAADILGRKFMHEALPPALDDSERKCSSAEDGPHWVGKELKTNAKNGITFQTEVRLVRAHACRIVQDNDNFALLFSTQNAKVHHGEEEQYLIIDRNVCPIVEILHTFYPNFVTVEVLQQANEQDTLDFVLLLWDYGIIVTKKPLQ